MSRRWQDTWCEYLESGLTPGEEQRLQGEISSDPRLSAEILEDAETHKLLQVVAAGDRAAADAPSSRSASPAAIADRVLRVIAAPTPEGPASAPAAGATIPDSRRQPPQALAAESRRRQPWAARLTAGLGGAAAAVVMGVMIAQFASPPPIRLPAGSGEQLSAADSTSTSPDDSRRSDTVAHQRSDGPPALSGGDDGGQGPSVAEPSGGTWGDGSRAGRDPTVDERPERGDEPPGAPSPPPRGPNARSAAADAAWTLAETQRDEAGDAPQWASPLPENIQGATLQLLEGTVTLMLRGAGELTVHAPAKFRPEAGRLLLHRGQIMARVIPPARVDVPGSRLEIISRAAILADEHGTAVRAGGAVGILGPRGRPAAAAVPPGGYRWIAHDGEVHHWMVAMLAVEGTILLTVNDQLCPLHQTMLRGPGAAVITTVKRQLDTQVAPADLRGMVLVNGDRYSYRGPRGIHQAGRRINDQFAQRFRAAKAQERPMVVNGRVVPETLNNAMGGDANQLIGGYGWQRAAVPAEAAVLLREQLRMIDSMSRSFNKDLAGVRRAVEAAQRQLQQAGPAEKGPAR